MSKRFFTIVTAKKDDSILHKFLEEFGYLPFEKEERAQDSRRSVLQISSNEELIEEVADFCKENNCRLQLIYKRNGQLVRQTFQSGEVFKPKPYGSNEGEKLKEPQLNKKNQTQQQPKNPQQNKNKVKSQNKNNRNKNFSKQKNISIMQDKPLPQVSDLPTENKPKSVSEVRVMTKPKKRGLKIS